jgi:peptidoglycan LD-endopeptidase CwlK
LKETDFPFTGVIPINLFSWNHSMRFNNSAAFDWRLVSNSSEVSDHSFDAAIDVNPLINPWMKKGARNRNYDPKRKGTLDAASAVAKIFKEEGWKWGGDWKHSKDWQHFYRPEIPVPPSAPSRSLGT